MSNPSYGNEFIDCGLKEGNIDSEEDPDIDLCNDETFGSGAVEDDWELNHNEFVGLEEVDFPLLKATAGKSNGCEGVVVPGLPAGCEYDEFELSNQHLAAAVEELVLNSDHDQDAIDPAIVSLRKQSSAPSSVIVGSASSPSLPSPFGDALSQNGAFTHHNTLFNGFPSPKPNNIWGDSQLVHNSPHHLPNGGSSLPRTTKLPPGFENRNQPQFEDEAILTAIPKSNNKPLLPNPMILKAEDLEREMQATSARVPSPTFGISIPMQQPMNDQSNGRSLPARSVSPVFGSPKPTSMPIGTPPKHMILDIMHQLEQQAKDHSVPDAASLSGSSGNLAHSPFKLPPGLPPGLPLVLRPPMMPNGARMPIRMPPPGANHLMWAPPRPPFNPIIAQDIMNRLGTRPNGMPIRSPRGPIHPNNIHPQMNPQMQIPPGGHNSPRMQLPFNRMRQGHPNGPPMPPMGPGQLHPEHSKFLKMRQRQNNNHRRNNHRNYDRVGRPGDPYAHIMTQREKDWVIRIQMMALQSDRPEIDDYYYQNYIEKRLEEGSLDVNQPKPQRLITPTKPNVDNRKYVPVQFNNSLGKLTTSSVYNPRQIIDVQSGPSQEEDPGTISDSGEQRQTLSKRLVVYKTIEKAYDLVIVMEEMKRSLELGDQQKKKTSLADLDAKIKLLSDALGLNTSRYDAHDDPVFQVMKIRKGKKIIARALSFFTPDHIHIIALSIFAHLAILIKRDARDGILHELYPPISNAISNMDKAKLSILIQFMSTFSLAAAVKDQVGVSLICKLLYCGNQVYGNDQEPDPHWKKFVSDVSDVIVNVANPKEGSRHARPSTPSPLLEDIPVDFSSILSSPTNTISQIVTSLDRLIIPKHHHLMEGVTKLI